MDFLALPPFSRDNYSIQTSSFALPSPEALLLGVTQMSCASRGVGNWSPSEAPLIAIEAMSVSFDAATFTGAFSRPVTRDRCPTVNTHTVDSANIVGPHWSVAGTHDYFETSIRALPVLLVAKNEVV